MKEGFRSAFASVAFAALAGCSDAARDVPTSDGSTEQLIARAAALELDTEYVPPPGLALHHQTAGFAKILCSGVFITGLDPEDVAANVGGFTAPFEQRGEIGGALAPVARVNRPEVEHPQP